MEGEREVGTKKNLSGRSAWPVSRSSWVQIPDFSVDLALPLQLHIYLYYDGNYLACNMALLLVGLALWNA